MHLDKSHNLSNYSMLWFISWVLQSWEKTAYCFYTYRHTNNFGFVPRFKRCKRQAASCWEIWQFSFLISAKKAFTSSFHIRCRPSECRQKMIWYWQMNKRCILSIDIKTTKSWMTSTNSSSMSLFSLPNRFWRCGLKTIDKFSRQEWIFGRTTSYAWRSWKTHSWTQTRFRPSLSS